MEQREKTQRRPEFPPQGPQKQEIVFPDGQQGKNPPAMQDTLVWSLGQEDPLEEETATRSSILVWIIPWTEEPGRLYRPWGRKE